MPRESLNYYFWDIDPTWFGRTSNWQSIKRSNDQEMARPPPDEYFTLFDFAMAPLAGAGAA